MRFVSTIVNLYSIYQLKIYLECCFAILTLVVFSAARIFGRVFPFRVVRACKSVSQPLECWSLSLARILLYSCCRCCPRRCFCGACCRCCCCRGTCTRRCCCCRGTCTRRCYRRCCGACTGNGRQSTGILIGRRCSNFRLHCRADIIDGDSIFDVCTAISVKHQLEVD